MAAGYAADFIPTEYAEFPFKIALPFWKKPIFIILVFVLLAGFVYAFIILSLIVFSKISTQKKLFSG